MSPNRFVPTTALISMALAATACAGDPVMKPAYARAAVEPIEVSKLDDSTLSLRYRVPPESMYFSKGVDYAASDDTISVYIRRCQVRETCAPMAETRIPLDQDWSAEVAIPYRGQRVVVVHTDGEQTVFPRP